MHFIHKLKAPNTRFQAVAKDKLNSRLSGTVPRLPLHIKAMPEQPDIGLLSGHKYLMSYCIALLLCCSGHSKDKIPVTLSESRDKSAIV